MWWGGWTYGPRHLIPVAIITIYEGVLYLSKKSFSHYFFYLLTGLGLLFAWMDKSTKIYMLPDDPNRFSNPIFDIVWPDFMKHHFNTNMIPVFLFDSSPTFSIYLWPLLFIVSMVFLAQWYTKLFPAPLKVVAVKPSPTKKKFNKK